MRVLVTGGAGFIGSHLVDRLVTEGYDVVVLDNLSSGSLNNIKSHIEAGNIVFVNGDLKEKHVVEDVVQGIDVVFHFAANPEVRVSTTNPEVHFRENVVATFNLLEAMRIKNVKEMVFASSSSVYGEPDVIPVDEEYPVRPVSVYGASKASCEALIHAYSKLYGIKAVVLRYANVVGPRMRHGVIYDLLMKLRENKSALEVLGDGFQVRSYLHVKDAVEATLVAWRKSSETYQVYNVGNTDWITVRELVEILLETLGLKGRVEVRYKPILHGVGWPGDVKRIALNSQKLMSLGWSPSMSSREAVVETVKALVRELNLKF
ncbi:MAG: NAD-dependent epimerase/dehydratase family protein [Desulfurococcaceae archaeon]|nr:NAD-dependent epimerase/dehydratase family protein [Desulfurococcaceae archaeon]